MKYPIVIHKDENSDFGITVPDIPGCFSAARSLDEAIENATEAILCHLEGLILDEEPIPQPTSIENHVSNPDYKGGTWAIVNVDVTQISGKSKRVNITIPERVLSQLDSFAKRSGSSRSGFFVTAAMEYMMKHQDQKSF
jgi:predicted RNase H-like HicB family nuclease